MAYTHVYGDNIDTDRIIAGKYTKTLNTADLVSHVLEDLDPDFKNKVQFGDILVAGHNFGCGSSREQAPVALKNSGLAAVIARSFARIFFRNAINIGLLALEIAEHDIDAGDVLEIHLASNFVLNKTKNKKYYIAKMPAVMESILAAGGLVAYMQAHGDYGNECKSIPKGCYFGNTLS